MKEKGHLNTSDHGILLVEDDANEIFLVRRAFQKANLSNPLQVARDGQEAVDYLSQRGAFANTPPAPQPVLMLLDLKMPRKNGFEVLEWVRGQPGLQQMVVVVFSSSDLPADVNRAYDLGANTYVVKPADFEELVRVIKFLEDSWLSTEREAGHSPPARPVSIITRVKGL